MPDISRGETRRIKEETSTDNLTAEQREAEVRVALEEMDAELTMVRHSSDVSISEQRDPILDAYVDRVMDLFEE